MLGVRRSIQLRGGEDELPAYVPRDVETDLLAALAAVKGRGGMVLVVGDSAVGKTRTLAEAVQTVLSDWWLLHPTGGVADVDALAASPAPRTVLWLDELQRYLEGLQAGTVRRLFAAGVVVVATLWPGEYGDRVALPGRDGPDLHADAREILHLARVVDVPGVFSDAELARARQAADGDPLLRTALSSTDAGMTQALAAGPELLTHWKNAPPAAKAVITAALDARRLGARAPLRREFLAEAAPPYLDRRQRGKLTNGDGWLDSALEYATTELHGATACLNPSAVTIGQLDGYTSADILYQQVLDLRRTEPVHEDVWRALLAHHDPDDTFRLAESALNLRRRVHAVAFYRRGAEAGDGFAAVFLARLLAEQGDNAEAIAVLVPYADAEHGAAMDHLATLLAAEGHEHEEELWRRAGTGDRAACDRLVEVMLAQGDTGAALFVLRKQAHPIDPFAQDRLATLLARLGYADELRERADAGDRYAPARLAQMLIGQGRTGDAVAALHRHAATVDTFALLDVIDELVERGLGDQALAVLRPLAEAGNWTAADRIAELTGVDARRNAGPGPE
jgi:hypothetical protein